jgi:hemoglobin
MNNIALNRIDTLYKELGEQTIRRLVNHFYDIMDTDPDVSVIRALHKDLSVSREKLFEFLVGRFGGPPLYTQKHGHPMLRARHAPFPIGNREKDQWISCMTRAMNECIPDKDLIGILEGFFQTVADSMRNKTE